MTTGQIISAYRKRMGLNQDSVADFLGIHRVVYTYYETDARAAPLEILEKLSNLFGITVDEFFEEDENQVSANVAFAFRADEILLEDLTAIAEFRKVIKNYLKLTELEKQLS